MTTNHKLTPRHEWLKNRVIEVVAALNHLQTESDWDDYILMAIKLADELTYATGEWEKYYDDEGA